MAASLSMGLHAQKHILRKAPYIIAIAGGSFQGKSLLAINLAARLEFGSVISTDLIRNFLKVLRPNTDYLGTSSYLLPDRLFQQQVHEVSLMLKDLLSIYLSRGEHVIVEGIHFSLNIIQWLTTLDNFIGIFIENRRPLRERILLKRTTRTNLHVERDNDVIFGWVNEETVDRTLYLKHEERISQIHFELRKLCEEYGFNIVKFYNLNEAYSQIISIVKKVFEA